MATTKEAGPKKKKSTSAPASPPKLQEPHRRSRTVPDAYHVDISKKITEQPTPHYLKPTISSCHDTNCHYPKHQQGPKPSATDPAAGKRLTVRKPTVEKAQSPTSASKKTAAPAISYKERAAKNISSSSAGKTTSTPTRTRLDKAAASKTSTGAKPLPLRKTKSLPKLNRKSKEPDNGAATVTGSVKEVELDALSPIGVVSEHEIVDGHHSQPSEVKDDQNKHDGEKEEEVDGDKVAAGERRQFNERERSVAEAIAKVEAKNLVFKKQDGNSGGTKESPPVSNAVIEEAANKLGYRRSKVRALAGAFETVISLQKPESHSGHHQEEETSGGGGRKEEQQELKKREDDQGEAESTLKEGEEGQQSQWGTKSKDGPGDVEETEHKAAVNVDNKSTEESITENPNEQE